MISTVPAAVCSFRGRLRRPLRAKSARAPHPGQANGADSPRTGAQRGPQTLSISRSCASSNAAANARTGTSRDICTANDSKSFHDNDASRLGVSIVRASVVLHICGDSFDSQRERLQSYKIKTEVQRNDTLPKNPDTCFPVIYAAIKGFWCSSRACLGVL